MTATLSSPGVDLPVVPAPERARRVAFASYVDENYLPGFLALLRSLALTNPVLCLDFVVLYDELRPTSVSAITRLHPRVKFRRVDTRPYDAYAKGDHTNYLVQKAYYSLEAFRIRDYDTIITLDTDMIVLGDIAPLLEIREGFAAVAQLYGNQTLNRLNSGLLVINREYLSDAFCGALDAVGRSGEYELDKHDQGMLNAVLDGAFIRIDPDYNFVKRRMADGSPLPETVKVLHYTGRHKPWNGGETGYDAAQAVWEGFDLPDEEFLRAYFDMKTPRHPEAVVHFGAQAMASGMASSQIAALVGRALLDLGRFEEAAHLVQEVERSPGPVFEDFHSMAGTALKAVSQYDEAQVHILLASRGLNMAAPALAELAEVSWVQHRPEDGRDYAYQGLTIDPFNRRVRIQARRNENEITRRDSDAGPEGRLCHAAFYMDGQGNAGDKVLPESVRRCFSTDVGDTTWANVHVHQVFDEERLRYVNRSRGLVLGGGGLFIPDTAPNGNSGWQWNVTDDVLRRIDVPLVTFGVGYNLFEGQAFTSERFGESLRILVDKATFVGLRNGGSIQRVRDALPPDLAERIIYQPCPTTVTRQLVDDWRDPEAREDVVLLNCAYDRPERRFGHDYGAWLREMRDWIVAARAAGRADVRYVAHAVTDERFVTDLNREHGINLHVVPMYQMTNREIWEAYAKVRLVVGMRGHATMIPFGVGTPVLSLVSHPKMRFFLEDIGRPDWGVSIHERRLASVLGERVDDVLERNDAVAKDVAELQLGLWETTKQNLAKLPYGRYSA